MRRKVKAQNKSSSSSKLIDDKNIKSASIGGLEDKAENRRRSCSKQTDYKNIQSSSGMVEVKAEITRRTRSSSVSKETVDKKNVSSAVIAEHNLKSVSVLLNDIRKDDTLKSSLGLEQQAQGLWKFSLTEVGSSRKPPIQQQTQRSRMIKGHLKLEQIELGGALEIKRENRNSNRSTVIKRNLKRKKKDSESSGIENNSSGKEKYPLRQNRSRSSIGNSSNTREKDNELVDSPSLKRRKLTKDSIKLQNHEEETSIPNSSQNRKGHRESNVKIDNGRSKRVGGGLEESNLSKLNENKKSDTFELQNISSSSENELTPRSSVGKRMKSAQVQRSKKTPKAIVESNISIQKDEPAEQSILRSESKRKTELDVENEILRPRKRIVKCQLEWCGICGIQMDSIINRLEHEFSHQEPRRLSVSLHRCHLKASSVKLPIYVNHEEVAALKNPQEDSSSYICTDDRPLLNVDDVLNQDEYLAYDYSDSEGEDKNLTASGCIQVDSSEKTPLIRTDEKDSPNSVKLEKSKKKGHVKMRLWNHKPIQTTRFGRVVKLTKKYEALSNGSRDLTEPSVKKEAAKSQSAKVDVVDHSPEEDINDYVEVVVTKEQREKPNEVIDLTKKECDTHISCRSLISHCEDAVNDEVTDNSEKVIVPVLEEASNGSAYGKKNEDTNDLDLIQVLNSETKIIEQQNTLKNGSKYETNDSVVILNNLEREKFQDLEVSKAVEEEENVINKSPDISSVISEISELDPSNVLIETDASIINTSPASLDKGNNEEDMRNVESVKLASEAMEEMEISGNVVSTLKEVEDEVESNHKNIDVQSRENNDEVGVSVNTETQTNTMDGVLDVGGGMIIKAKEVAGMVEQSNVDSHQENIGVQSKEDVTEESGVPVNLETETEADDIMDVAGDLILKSKEIAGIVEQSKLALTQENIDAQIGEIGSDVGVPLNLEGETEAVGREDEIISENFDLESGEVNNEKDNSENGSINENLESKLGDDGNQAVSSEIEGVWGNSESSEADELRMCGNRDETVFGKDVAETLDTVTSCIDDEMDPFELKNLSSNDVSVDLNSRHDEVIRFESAESEESENVNFKVSEVVNEDREVGCNSKDNGLEDISDGEFELDDDMIMSTEKKFCVKSVIENEEKSSNQLPLESLGSLFTVHSDDKTLSIENRKHEAMDESANDRKFPEVCSLSSSEDTMKGGTIACAESADHKNVSVPPLENKLQPNGQVVIGSVAVTSHAPDPDIKSERQSSCPINTSTNVFNKSPQTKECDVHSLDKFADSIVSNGETLRELGDEKTVVCCK